MAISSVSRGSGMQRSGVVRPRVATCRVVATASARVSVGSPYNTSTALSITAASAASALFAKVSAVGAVGVGPSALLTLLDGQTTFKPSEKIAAQIMAFEKTFAGKVAISRAPAPAAEAAGAALPRSWDVATSAAQWFELNRQATDAGILLATIFVSDNAARAHGPLLERLRLAYGTGANTSVRFVFVHVGDGYNQRERACSNTAAVTRGSRCLTLGCVSHTATYHGLDVALSAFLPDGPRAFPSLLLTAGPADADGSTHFSATTRVSELTQLVSDGAFVVISSRTAATATEVPALTFPAVAKQLTQPARMGASSTVSRAAAKVRESVVLVAA